MAFRPVLALTALVSGRSLRPAPTGHTNGGKKELSYDRFDYTRVKEDLIATGTTIEILQVEEPAFADYLRAAQYETYHSDYYCNAASYRIHKQIQHYLSLQPGPATKREIWMDVASSSSPFPDIVTRLFGITVYRQDLSYPEGIHGLRIGSDAASVPLPANCVDRISLHCSYEHFENGSDGALIPEIARLLKHGGVATIIPLYVANTYQILTNPRYWLARGIPREDGAQITVSQTYWESHGRFYDAATLNKRVLQRIHASGLNHTIYEVHAPAGIDYPPFLSMTIRKVG